MKTRNASKKRLALLAAAIVIATFSFLPSLTAKADEWAEKKQAFEAARNEGRCEDYWALLWPDAKAGNLEARQLLFFQMAVRLHSDVVFPPGRHGDQVTLLRDILIFAVHSLGAPGDGDAFKTASEAFFSQSNFSSFARGQDFLKCMRETGDQTCAEVAVRNKLVPSFEEYAAEIDALIASGAKSVCVAESKTSQH